MKTLAIIPARSGSKGVPRKNTRTLRGKPLLCWSIEAAMKSKHIDRVVVSTEDYFTRGIAESWGAEVVPRPKELATDEAPTDPVMLHALWRIEPFYKPELVVLLQPTSPFRPDGLIDDCIDRLLKTKADSLVTVYRGPHFYWWKEGRRWASNCDPETGRVRRQDMKAEYERYPENGNVYVTKAAKLKETGRRVCGKIECYVMDRMNSIEIDDEFDFWIAEARIQRDALGNERKDWECLEVSAQRR